MGRRRRAVVTSGEPKPRGPCAWICPECHGTQHCRECGDGSRDDFGGCGECGGAGGCSYCYEGMVADD